MASRPLPTVVISTLCAVIGLAWQGCSAPSRDFSQQLAEHNATQGKQPTMAGESLFADGKVAVEVQLSRGFKPRFKKGVLETNERYNPFGSSEEGSSEEKPRYQSIADDEDLFVPRMHNSIIPPQALRIRVTNESLAEVTVTYLECNSSLGNFAVRPETAKILPRESNEPNAMISLLGASGEDIPVKVSLSINGKTETQTIVMKLVALPPTTKKK